ncbi:hypothetical protein OY671_012417, partial [Metschnikowia pulcherrima]
RGAGAVRRGFRRRTAQGQGHVPVQQRQGHRLPADAVRAPSPAGVCGRGAGGRGVLAGQVRHPHRIAATVAAGQSQWSDRGPDHHLHHLRRGAGGAAHGTCRGAVAAVLRPPGHGHRHRHPAGGRHRHAGDAVRAGGWLQPAHPAHRHAPAG